MTATIGNERVTQYLKLSEELNPKRPNVETDASHSTLKTMKKALSTTSYSTPFTSAFHQIVPLETLQMTSTNTLMTKCPKLPMQQQQQNPLDHYRHGQSLPQEITGIHAREGRV
jgi:hypothetical protein